MSPRDPGQLDLLSGYGPPPEPAPPPDEVRWARVDAAGRLGWIDGGPPLIRLRDAHRVSVVLAIGGDPKAWIARAREAGIDLRHLRGVADGVAVLRHAAGLAADLRHGRRALVVGASPGEAALVVACALVEQGLPVAEAIGAIGGEAVLGGSTGRLEELVEGREPAAFPSESEPASASASAPASASATAPASQSASEREPASAPVPEPAPAPAPESASAFASALASAPESAPESASAFASALASAAAPSAAPAPESASALAPESARAPASASVTEPTLRAIANDPWRARVGGAVLGAAVGDAMGHPTEFVDSFEAIRDAWPPNGVTGYVLHREDERGRRFAPYTDDTQMAEQVLRSLIGARERGRLDDLDATMRDLAARFVRWADDPQGGHRAPGNACLAGCRNLARGVEWREAGGARAGGCGSVMRAYPFGIVFADDLPKAEAWAVASSALTHRDPIALAACAAMAVGVARSMRGERPVWVWSEMVAAACRYSPSTAEMIARALDEALSGVPPETTLERLRGWAAHEAIAAAVYVMARHPDDARAAILEAANTPGDSDSIATLAGALVGARVGIAGLPAEWVTELERADVFLALVPRL